jgi:hypothetical protein
MLFTTIFASFIFLIGIIIIYKKYSKLLDQFVFALFVFIAPWMLINFNFGGDLLALGFVLLAFGVKSPKLKGFLLAISTLSRYNFIAFLPFFIWELRKKPKDMLSFSVLFLVPWLPWFYFNYLYSGNIFFSFIETFYLNVISKSSDAFFLFDQIFILVLFIGLFFIFCRKTFKFDIIKASWLSVLMFVFLLIIFPLYLVIENPRLRTFDGLTRLMCFSTISSSRDAFSIE